MPKYDVDIPHSLAPEEAHARLERASVKLERDYGATCSWANDRELMVTRKGLDARVRIEPQRVHVDISLGLLLTPMAGAIKSGITRELTSILSGNVPIPGEPQST